MGVEKDSKTGELTHVYGDAGNRQGMTGFLVYGTGSHSHPVAFVYAADRDQCLRELEKYLRREGTGFYVPSNWTVEPVTPAIETVTRPLVLAPNIHKH